MASDVDTYDESRTYDIFKYLFRTSPASLAHIDATEGCHCMRAFRWITLTCRCHEIESLLSVRRPRRILRRRKVRRPVRIIAPAHETGSPRVVNRPCPLLKLCRGVATYCRGKEPRSNMRGRQNALKSEADEVEEIHTITLIMQLFKRSCVSWT